MTPDLSSFMTLLRPEERIVATAAGIQACHPPSVDGPAQPFARGLLVVTSERLALWGPSLLQWRWTAVLRISPVDSGRAVLVIAGRHRSVVLTSEEGAPAGGLRAALVAAHDVAPQLFPPSGWDPSWASR